MRDPAPRTLVFACVTMALLALGAERAVRRAYPDLDLPTSVVPPGAGIAAPPRTPPRRVMLVVLDGLRADVAHTLPNLRALAARGASVTLRDEPPTYSAAQYVAMLTGVPPRDSGIRTNVSIRRAGLDSVPRRVRAGGRTSREVGDCVDWWQRLFGEDFSSAEWVPKAELLAAVAPRARDADFLVVHTCGVDDAGHAAGGGTEQYRAAAREADRKLGIWLAGWTGTVVVVADHGHTLGGGHGGDEPDVVTTWMVAAGPGVSPGEIQGVHSALAVAPTLSALLGVGAPAQAEGRALIGLLDASDAVRDGLQRDDAARADAVERATVPRRRALRARETRARALRGVLCALVAIACGRALRRRGGLAARGALAGLVASALFWAVFPAMMGGVSFSAAREAHQLMLSSAGTSAALGVISVAAVLRLTRARLPADSLGWLGVGLAAGASLPALAGFTLGGVYSPRFACEPASLAAFPGISYAAFFGTTVVGLLLALGALAARRGYTRAS